jgi:hypothetical protein
MHRQRFTLDTVGMGATVTMAIMATIIMAAAAIGIIKP